MQLAYAICMHEQHSTSLQPTLLKEYLSASPQGAEGRRLDDLLHSVLGSPEDKQRVVETTE
jgi:hypothetical protein